MAKTERKPDDKEQSKRFIEKAREIESDETGKSFDRALKEIAPPRKRTKSKPINP